MYFLKKKDEEKKKTINDVCEACLVFIYVYIQNFISIKNDFKVIASIFWVVCKEADAFFCLFLCFVIQTVA